MVRSIILLIIVPLSSVFAQHAPVHLTITSANMAQFRVVRSSQDSVQRPMFGRGRWDIADSGVVRDAAAAETVEIAALDTLSPVHVEATQNGRVIASGEGAYVTVRRQSDAISIDARSRAPASVRITKP